MSGITIQTPANVFAVDGPTTCTLSFDPLFGAKWSSNFSSKQKIVDSEVLRYCAPMMPLRTGMLIQSGTLGTDIGSGLVEYIAPYARFQYYRTAEYRSYDHNRGGKWFERMKTAHKADILRAAQGG